MGVAAALAAGEPHSAGTPATVAALRLTAAKPPVEERRRSGRCGAAAPPSAVGEAPGSAEAARCSTGAAAEAATTPAADPASGVKPGAGCKHVLARLKSSGLLPRGEMCEMEAAVKKEPLPEEPGDRGDAQDGAIVDAGV